MDSSSIAASIPSQLRAGSLNPSNALVIPESLCASIDQELKENHQLLHLRVGKLAYKYLPNGLIWGGRESINECLAADVPPRSAHASSLSHEESEDEDEFQMDVKHISATLTELQSLHLDSGFQLKRQPVAPALLRELTQLKELRMCPLNGKVRCDKTRDEWNFRALAQKSKKLEILDLRGCYLKIFSLGWLSTEKIEAIHLYYQVPAAFIIARWTPHLKYLTLARVSAKYKSYRSWGPAEPGEELDACLRAIASSLSPLTQLDLQQSDCSAEPLRSIVLACGSLTYLDTRGCEKLASNLRVRYTDRESIRRLFPH